MRELVVTENMSLDGIIAPMDGWFDPGNQDADLSAVVAEHREAADAVVLGRLTYEEFAGFWPYRVDDTTGISSYLDRVAKYVFSSSLERADWQNTTIVRGPVRDELITLKEADGMDIVATGSASLVQSIVPTGLVDCYRLFVYPVVQGHGRRLFEPPARVNLSLTNTRTFRSGVVLLEYRASR